DGLLAVNGAGARVEQRIDHVVEVSVAQVVQAQGPIHRGNHHHVIGAVDAGVHHARRQQRLDHHNEAPAVVGGGRHLEIGVGGDNHLRERIVQLVGGFVVRVVGG